MHSSKHGPLSPSSTDMYSTTRPTVTKCKTHARKYTRPSVTILTNMHSSVHGTRSPPNQNANAFKYVRFGTTVSHDDVIKWKHFPRYWPFVREIHRSPVNFPHKGQWRGPLMFTLICTRMNGWVNNREAGDLRRYLVHYDVIVMCWV